MDDLTGLDGYVRDEASRRALREAADLPTERARNGEPILSYRNVRLHSAINPSAEAEDQTAEFAGALREAMRANPNADFAIVILGPGLGYIVRAIENVVRQAAMTSTVRIVCLDLAAEVARKALQLRVWEPAALPVAWYAGAESVHRVCDSIPEQHFVVTATAGYRLEREQYEAIQTRLSGKPVAERPMRVLVPTPLYGGSLPAAFHCADALRELGHQVELLDFSPYYVLFRNAESVTNDVGHRRALQNLLTAYLAETIVARALDWRADLVWAVAQTPLTPPALQELRHENVHSALWFVEDFRVFPYWRDLAVHFDAVFTIQRGDFHDALDSLGVRNKLYLPCAANPRLHRPLDLTADERSRFGADVSFVGAGYHNRQTLFARLPLPGLRIWGNDWPPDCAVARFIQEQGRRVTSEETAMIYNATRVNLNLHSSPHHDGLNPHGDFVNPRTFEIAACGAFQIVDRRRELDDLFDTGNEVTVVEREEEIPALVQYYLEHEDERQQIARRARDRVLREHTYVHRMEAALRFCEERLPRLAGRKRGPNYVSTLKAAAAGDPELLEFLASFPEDQELTLDDIVSRIELGKGELSRAEGIFLLMREFRDWGREKGVIQ